MQKTYKIHNDSGHGWLEVPLADVMLVGLTPDSFSRYSRVHVTDLYIPMMYLEEDLDLPIFLLAAKRKGIDVQTRDVYVDGDSFVRSYSTNTAGREFTGAELRDLMQAFEEELRVA